MFAPAGSRVTTGQPWLVPSMGCRADPVSPRSCHGNLHGRLCHFAWRNLRFLATAKPECKTRGSASRRVAQPFAPGPAPEQNPHPSGSKGVGRGRESKLSLAFFPFWRCFIPHQEARSAWLGIEMMHTQPFHACPAQGRACPSSLPVPP